jgi:hypothetical protein
VGNVHGGWPISDELFLGWKTVEDLKKINIESSRGGQDNDLDYLNPKSETRSTKQIQITKISMTKTLARFATHRKY